MSLLSKLVNKCLSVLRLGRSWFNQLLASIVEAGRTISYVETVSPSQADTLHKEIKWCDTQVLKREFEKCVRIVLKSKGFGRVKLGVDVTEDLYWGEKGLCNTRSKAYEKSEESWQYVNISIVEPYFVPLMSLPYRQADNLDNLVIELLDYTRTLPLHIETVLFDRGFYHWRLIDYLENCRGEKPWPYIIFLPKHAPIKEYVKRTKDKLGAFKHQGKHYKDKTGWKPTTKVVVCKGIGKDKNGKPIDWCFATNQRASLNLVRTYRKRWNIETGFRIHDEARIKSKSSHPLIRYFYHLISMLLILMWRLHNHFNPYMVFKRFLKRVETVHISLVQKPPPHTITY